MYPSPCGRRWSHLAQLLCNIKPTLAFFIAQMFRVPPHLQTTARAAPSPWPGAPLLLLPALLPLCLGELSLSCLGSSRPPPLPCTCWLRSPAAGPWHRVPRPHCTYLFVSVLVICVCGYKTQSLTKAKAGFKPRARSFSRLCLLRPPSLPRSVWMGHEERSSFSDAPAFHLCLGRG